MMPIGMQIIEISAENHPTAIAQSGYVFPLYVTGVLNAIVVTKMNCNKSHRQL
jgi:hypothetical protein